MKYFQRFRTDNSRFFIDELGNEVDEATAKTNLQEKSPRPKLSGMRITESLAEFDALLRRPVVTEFDAALRRRAATGRQSALSEQEARSAAATETKIIKGWVKLGLTEEAAKIAAHVESDMRKSAKDFTTEDWAKLRW